MKREISLSKSKMPWSSKDTKQVAYEDELFLLSKKRKTLQVLYKRAYPFLSVKDFKKETFKMGYKPLSDQVHHKKALTRTASLILQKSSHSKKKLHKKKLQKLVQVFYKPIFKGRVYVRLLSSLVCLRNIACLSWKARALAFKESKLCYASISTRKANVSADNISTKKANVSANKKKNNAKTSIRKNKSISNNKKVSQPDSEKKRSRELKSSQKESRALKSFKKTHFFLSTNRGEQKTKTNAFRESGALAPPLLLVRKKPSCPSDNKCLVQNRRKGCFALRRDKERSKKEKQSILASFLPLRSLDLVEQAVEEVKPYIEPRTIRRGKRKKRVVPLLISNNRAKSLAVKWLIQAAKKRQTIELDLSQSLALEVLDALNKRGEPRQRRDRLHKLARSNRDNARFSWW